MVNGLLLFESGEYQQIGNLSSLQGIINTIEQLLPQLKAQESMRVVNQLSDEELENIINARKNKAVTGNTERLTDGDNSIIPD